MDDVSRPKVGEVTGEWRAICRLQITLEHERLLSHDADVDLSFTMCVTTMQSR